MRRVAHFSSDFLPTSQAFVYQEVSRHVRYEVDAFAQRRQNVDRFPFERLHTLIPGRGPLGWAEYLTFLSTRWSPSFAWKFHTLRFMLIHAQFGPAAVYALPYAERFDLPLVCTFGGIDVAALEPTLKGRPDYLFYQHHAPAMLQRVDRFLAVSRNLADRLIAVGAPADRVHVFLRGVEVPKICPPHAPPGPGGPVVLMVGRFVEKKGFEDGLKAAATLVAEGIELRIRMVGEGPLLETYQTLARESGLGDRVTFTGRLSQAQVFDEMCRADVFLAPSVTAATGDTEGIPNVLKEANARGLPAVVTHHGGLPEVVDEGETGFVVPERGRGAIAARLRSLVTSRDLRVRMGTAAWQKMRSDLDIDARIGVLEEHYDAAIRTRKEREREERT
jgi:colanic acid/amylovoran biosynthesis glycosyltransferase